MKQIEAPWIGLSEEDYNEELERLRRRASPYCDNDYDEDREYDEWKDSQLFEDE